MSIYAERDRQLIEMRDKNPEHPSVMDEHQHQKLVERLSHQHVNLLNLGWITNLQRTFPFRLLLRGGVRLAVKLVGLRPPYFYLLLSNEVFFAFYIPIWRFTAGTN